MATHPAVRSLEYWAYQYKRTWRGSIVSSFLQPVLFLAAMGLGLGSIVNRHGATVQRLGGVDYVVFLAPGLLAATAMQVGAAESTYPVMAAIKWLRTYHAMLSTPLRIVDVLVGHLLWIAFRVLLAVTVFLLVMAAFGATRSWTAVLAVPAALLTGMAFVTPIVAYAATQERDIGFSAIFRFGIMPMFLFSGTFFPVSQLPAAVRPLAYATPLWHGVDLCRTLSLGDASALPTLGHVCYLVAFVVAGTWAAAATYRRRLSD
jgi:lipooligosaccharide transport system permease protein